MGLEAVSRLGAGWYRETRIVAVLGREADAASGAGAVVAAVEALAGVAAVRHVPAAEALAELTRALGPVEAGLARLPVNPVPARLEIRPRSGLGAARLRELIASLARVPGVEAVESAVGWVGALERIEHAIRLAGSTLAAGLAVTALLALAGATALARHRRADETAVLRLAGVGDGWLRTPLIIQATVQGAAGGALGVGVIALVSGEGGAWAAGWLRAGVGIGPLPELGWPWSAVLAGGGLALGLVSGLGSAGRP
jgi:cell division protein FtsX